MLDVALDRLPERLRDLLLAARWEADAALARQLTAEQAEMTETAEG